MKPIECMTHKTGKFTFSCNYDSATIQAKQIEASVLYGSVRDLPILPRIAAQLNEDLIRRSIFGTAAIEGNSLSEEEVQNVLDTESRGDLLDKAEIEIVNLKSIYGYLEQGKTDEGPYLLEESLIKDIHEALTTGLDYYHNSPGMYRNEVVKVGDRNHGGVYTPPKTLDDIKKLMPMFVEWVNSEEMLAADSLLRAALAHYHLAKIHPFQDGNGRTARFVEALILDRSGIKYIPKMLSNYYYRKIDDYFIAFSETQKGDKYDVTPFLSFYFDGVIDCIREVKEQVVYSIRQLSLKDFYSFQREEKLITQRQHDLLQILLQTLEPFTHFELFSKPIFKHLYARVSESTARRDIKKLFAGGYIVRNKETDEYELNIYVLD